MMSTEDYFLFGAPVLILVFAVVMAAGFFLLTRKLRARLDKLEHAASNHPFKEVSLPGGWSAKATAKSAETRTATPQR